MNCDKTYELIHEYFDGTLDDSAAVALEGHARKCQRCAQELRAYRKITGMLNVMERAEVPAGFSDGIIDKLRSAGRIATTVDEPARTGWFASVPWRLRIPAVVAIVMLVAIAVSPSTIGVLASFAGKSAVVATDIYVTVQDQAGRVEALRGVVEGMATLVRLVKTVIMAAFSIVATLGSVFKVPAFTLIILLSAVAGVYIRVQHKRGAHHASYSF